jgi:4-hydroxybenzoate polyprenyltransferase
MGYRGWKVWMSYDFHIILLVILYNLLIVNQFRFLDSLLLVSLSGFYLMFGFLINDYFDIAIDRAAGKTRVIQELPKILFIAIILTIFSLSMLHFLYFLYLRNFLFFLIFASSYILGFFYCAPPLRFKSRGIVGIVINALTEKALPVLAIFAFFYHFGIDTLLFVTTSFSIHVSEIVTHQILDYESDLKTGIHSYVIGRGTEKSLIIFKNFLSPISGLLIVFLCIFLSIKVPYIGFLIIMALITYVVLLLVISKGIIIREEKIFPLYLSCLYILINNVFPPFLAFILILESPINTIFFLVAIGSQYYVAKHRYNSIKQKVFSHMEIFVDS